MPPFSRVAQEAQASDLKRTDPPSRYRLQRPSFLISIGRPDRGQTPGLRLDATSDQEVINDQHHHRAEHCDQQAVHVEPRDT